jgi:hypothetical protein
MREERLSRWCTTRTSRGMLIIHSRTPRPSPGIYKEYRYPLFHMEGSRAEIARYLGVVGKNFRERLGRITGPLVFPGEFSICDQAK